MDSLDIFKKFRKSYNFFGLPELPAPVSKVSYHDPGNRNREDLIVLQQTKEKEEKTDGGVNKVKKK